MDGRDFASDLQTVMYYLPRTEHAIATPVLILISGLPGTGKSFLAREIAARLPAVIVEGDWIRKLLFGRPTYAGSESVWTHRIAHAAIQLLLASGWRVIYDATNLSEWHRAQVYRIADRTHARLVIVQTVAPERLVRERLSRRQEDRHPLDLSEATWDIYERLKRRVDPVRRPHIVVNTGREIDHALVRILRSAR